MVSSEAPPWFADGHPLPLLYMVISLCAYTPSVSFSFYMDTSPTIVGHHFNEITVLKPGLHRQSRSEVLEVRTPICAVSSPMM